MKNILFAFLLCVGFVGESFGQYSGYSEQLTDWNDKGSEVICGAADANPNDPMGGFILTGFYTAPCPTINEHDPFLIRIDQIGNEKWVKDLDYFDYGYPQDAMKCAHYMKNEGDKHFFLVGSRHYLRKIKSSDDPNGVVVFRHDITDIDGIETTGIHYIEKFTDHKYLIINFWYRHCWIFDASIGTNGDVLEEKHLHIGDHYLIYCGKLTTDNKFIFSGQCNGQLTLCRTDIDLNLDTGFGNRG